MSRIYGFLGGWLHVCYFVVVNVPIKLVLPRFVDFAGY